MYIVAYLILLCLALMSFQKKTLFKSGTEYFSLFVLVSLAASSFHNGWDTHAYKAYFEYVEQLGWSGVQNLFAAGIEFGFSLLLFFVSSITSEFQVFIALISIISCTLMFLGVRKIGVSHRLYAIFYLTSFFLPFQLSTLRQGMAVAVVIFSFQYVLNQKKWHFLLAVVVAMLFHYSAILVMIFYPFYQLKISKRQGGLIALGAIPFFFISGKLSGLTLLILELDIFSSFHLAKQVLVYFLRASKSGFPPVLLISLMIFAVFFLFVYSRKKRAHNFTFKLYLFLIIVQFYFNFLPGTVVARLEYYFIIAQVFSFCLIIEKLVKERRSIVVVGTLVVVPLLMLAITVRNPFFRQAYFPFHSYWGHVLFNEVPRTPEDIGCLAEQYSK